MAKGGDGFWVGLEISLAGKAVQPPVPSGRMVSVPDDELDDEPDHLEAHAKSEEVPFPGALFIEYRDSKGQLSQRRIICREYDASTRLLRAVCQERKALRSFRVDRIELACCTVTGEVFEIEEVLTHLLSRGVGALDGRLRRVVLVLVYLMRCDRDVADEELEVLERAITSFALRFAGDDATVADGLRMANLAAPTDKDFLKALQWVSRHPERRKLAAFIRQWAHEMVVADGVLAFEEHVAGRAIDEALQALEAQ